MSHVLEVLRLQILAAKERKKEHLFRELTENHDLFEEFLQQKTLRKKRKIVLHVFVPDDDDTEITVNLHKAKVTEHNQERRNITPPPPSDSDHDE